MTTHEDPSAWFTKAIYIMYRIAKAMHDEKGVLERQGNIFALPL